jgi:hypothetical protein
MIMATFGVDISSGLLDIGGIVGGDWIGGVITVVGPFIISESRFTESSVKLAFCFLFGKHMAESGGGLIGLIS